MKIDIFINITIAALALYSAWVNLVVKKISSFGFDAFLIAAGKLIDVKQAVRIRKNDKLIRRMGIIMLLFGIGAIYAVYLSIKGGLD